MENAPSNKEAVQELIAAAMCALEYLGPFVNTRQRLEDAVAAAKKAFGEKDAPAKDARRTETPPGA